MATGAVIALALAVAARADAYIYWGNWENGSETAGQDVGRAELDGTGVDKSFLSTPPGSSPCGVGLSDDGKYLAVGLLTDSAVGVFSLALGNVGGVFHVQNAPCGAAINDQYWYWSSGAPSAARTNPPGTTIGRATLDGSEVDPNFITGLDEPCGLAIDDEYIYWADSRGLGRANLDGTGVQESFAVATTNLDCGVAVDDENIYWTLDGGIFYTAFENPNGTFESVAETGGVQACGLDVDDQYIYWATNELAGRAAGMIGRATLDGSDVDQNFIPNVPYPCGVAVDVPSNDFRLGAVDKDTRHGRARIKVKVPGPGNLALARTKDLKPVRRHVDKAGKVRHPIKPRRRAKRELRRDGAVRVMAKITFTPDGGRPQTKRRKLRLIKRG